MTAAARPVAPALSREAAQLGAIADRHEQLLDRVVAQTEVSFDEILRMGGVLVKTGFLPEHIKTDGQAAAIILAGRELGMKPMRALRSLVLVKGKVVESADSQLARFKSDGGRAGWKRLDEQGATLVLRHPNGDEHEESFTMEDAKRAGLAGKDIWKNYPKAMLRSRVITAGLKSIGWEGGAGAYDPDEAVAFTPPMATDSRPVGVTSDGVDTREDREPTLEEAAAYPIPFGEKKGQPLGEASNKLLAAIASWATKQRDVPDGFARAGELLRMANVVIADRKGQVSTSPEAPAPGPAGSATEATKTGRDLEDDLVKEAAVEQREAAEREATKGKSREKATVIDYDEKLGF